MFKIKWVIAGDVICTERSLALKLVKLTRYELTDTSDPLTFTSDMFPMPVNCIHLCKWFVTLSSVIKVKTSATALIQVNYTRLDQASSSSCSLLLTRNVTACWNDTAQKSSLQECSVCEVLD